MNNEPNNNDGYYGYVYLTTNLVNGKKYIGKHVAQKFTYDYKGSGKVLRLAFSKYGKNNFSVELIGWYECPLDLELAERYWISVYSANNSRNYYNLAKGGEGGVGGPMMKGKSHSLETRRKMSIARKGKKFSDSHRSNLSKSVSLGKLGVKLSEEHKLAISLGVTGDKNPFYGRQHSEDTRLLMSQRQKEVYKDKPRIYRFKCSNCNKESEGTGSRQHICIACRKEMDLLKSKRKYTKQYKVTCKHCGQSFLGNAPTSNKCSSCKGGDGK